MSKKAPSWCYYSYTAEQYKECMDKIFINNLLRLRQANIVFCIFSLCFSLVVFMMERNYLAVIFCLAVAFSSSLFAIFANYKLQKPAVSRCFLYCFITISYINVMALGIYLGVWASPDKPAVIFLCFLICTLLLFVVSPLFNLALTLSAMMVFIVSSFFVKPIEISLYDFVYTIVTGIIAQYFSWHITKLRLGLEISASLLEQERNIYFDQSTIDELTRLNNRRDFMQTFKRYLSSHRTSDDWLCISIIDIDYFKNYNDRYGHVQGDEALRSAGKAFSRLHESLGVYTARVGGEEFAMLWFEKDASHVDTVVASIFKLIQEMNIVHESSNISKYLTISLGVYVERCGASNDVNALYDLADKALYTAKGNGRNRAIIRGREFEQYEIIPDNAMSVQSLQ